LNFKLIRILNREFVRGIYSLDEQAKKSNVAVISGASTVPGISSAVVEHLSKHFSVMESIE
jgi:saccharopine dehydrogenase-like NADP-dependent oxidoreductase